MLRRLAWSWQRLPVGADRRLGNLRQVEAADIVCRPQLQRAVDSFSQDSSSARVWANTGWPSRHERRRTAAQREAPHRAARWPSPPIPRRLQDPGRACSICKGRRLFRTCRSDPNARAGRRRRFCHLSISASQLCRPGPTGWSEQLHTRYPPPKRLRRVGLLQGARGRDSSERENSDRRAPPLGGNNRGPLDFRRPHAGTPPIA